MGKFYVSTNKELLNLDLIHDYLANQSYWAAGRTMDQVRKTIEHSLCFGLYQGAEQVGFARVITDYAIMAWIMDVFILPTHQNVGLGKHLMSEIMNHPTLQQVQRWGLNTKDAHGLYEQFGFRPLDQPQFSMTKGDHI